MYSFDGDNWFDTPWLAATDFANQFSSSILYWDDKTLNIEYELRKFAREQALSLKHLWDMPDIVKEYLETGDETIREEAATKAVEAAEATGYAAEAAEAPGYAAEAAEATGYAVEAAGYAVKAAGYVANAIFSAFSAADATDAYHFEKEKEFNLFIYKIIMAYENNWPKYDDWTDEQKVVFRLKY